MGRPTLRPCGAGSNTTEPRALCALAAITALAAIVLLRHQSTIPAQDRLWRRDGGDLGQRLAPHLLAEHGQPPPVGIREPHLPAESLPQDSVLSRQVVDLLLQHPSEPHRQPRCQELQRQWKHRSAGLVLPFAHGGAFYTFPRPPQHLQHCSQPSGFASLFADRVLGQDAQLDCTLRQETIAARLARTEAIARAV